MKGRNSTAGKVQITQVQAPEPHTIPKATSWLMPEQRIRSKPCA